FREARVRIGSDKSDSKPPEVRGRPTSELIAERSHNNEALAELEWRISLILSVPIIGLAAIPLARVNPRQGRFYRLIPAVIGYLGYVGMLLVCRSSINDSPAGAVPWYLNMAWVHLIALVAVMLLYLGPSLRRRRVR
ncbi:MAG: LptF/LptG family permease, partial [Alcanivorax sp.]|nr:LptF/LptG family permease [Alcanivorax sp.]